MSKVYIVFEGCYSDRDVVYVASSMEQAKKFINHQSSCDLEILEYEIDSPVPEKDIYDVHINNINHEVTNASLRWNKFVPVDSVFMYKNGIMTMVIEARDAQHAIKIASERLMMILGEPYLYPQLGDRCECIFNFKTKEEITKTWA